MLYLLFGLIELYIMQGGLIEQEILGHLNMSSHEVCDEREREVHTTQGRSTCICMTACGS